MQYAHYTAHLRRRAPDLRNPRLATRLWAALREAFPLALAALLMPDHGYLIAAGDDVERDWKAFVLALRGFARGLGEIWEPIGPPKILPDVGKLWTEIRYVLDNPLRQTRCQCSDPLQWLWSTHRDVMGAVADPWVPADRLATALGKRVFGFRDTFHGYVSRDKDVGPAGTPPPLPAPPSEFPQRSIDDLIAAAATATRQLPTAVAVRGPTRQLFLALAEVQGFHDRRQLAEICRITPRAINKPRAAVPRAALDAAALCLGDDRLRLWLRQVIVTPRRRR